MAQPQGKTTLVISVEFEGRQSLARIKEVIDKGLNECERIHPISESIRVRETLLSQVQYQYWRRQRIRQARPSKWSWERCRSILVDIAKIVVPPVVANYFLNRR